MRNLDLSKVKKIAQDKKKATLLHPDGKEITIAIAALNPKMKEALIALPLHQADPQGAVEAPDNEEDDNQEPAAPVKSENNAAPISNAVEAPDNEEDDNQEPAAPVKSENNAAPISNAPAAAGPTPPTAQDINNEALNFHNDMQMGHIQPKTYQDLFADKSTLGKIGTIFGLLASGAGSGLTHQPNLLMEMMNKQLDRDLDAQKNTNVNAQNWYRLGQQHELIKAQIGRYGIENQLTAAQISKIPAEIKELAARGELTQAQISKVPSEIRENLARANEAGAQAALAHSATAKNNMALATLKELQNHTDQMPPGPNKDAAQNVLDTHVVPAVTGEIQKNSNAAAAAYQNAAAKTLPQEQADNGVDINRFQDLVRIGRAEEGLLGFTAKGMPASDVAAATKEAEKVLDNRAVAKIYDDSFKKLDQMRLAGKLTPGARAAELNALGAQVARATAGRYNAQEATAQANGMFPEVGDWQSTKDEKYRKSMDFFKSEEAGTPTLDRHKLKTPFPFSTRQKSEKIIEAGNNPVERQTADGRTALFDPKTQKFLGYKGQEGKSATAGK